MDERQERRQRWEQFQREKVQECTRQLMILADIDTLTAKSLRKMHQTMRTNACQVLRNECGYTRAQLDALMGR